MTLSSRIAPALDSGVTAIWAAGFTLLGVIQPHLTQLWSSPGELKVIVVAPHPDDEVIGCAGTILRHRLAGDEVTVIVVTDGRRSRAGGLGPEAMAARREAEAREAAARLGATMCWLGLPEGEWHKEELAGIAPALNEADVVYAPSCVDFHPEHLQVAHALAGLQPSATEVRVYGIHTPLTAVLTNFVAPLDGTVAGARHAAAAYRSQADSVNRSWRTRRYAARRHRLPGLVEPFWQIRGALYARLHAGPPAHWSEQPYRALRGRSWSDPLAYVAGLAERRRLAAGPR